MEYLITHRYEVRRYEEPRKENPPNGKTVKNEIVLFESDTKKLLDI